jgi:hypothetical protein
VTAAAASSLGALSASLCFKRAASNANCVLGERTEREREREREREGGREGGEGGEG